MCFELVSIRRITIFASVTLLLVSACERRSPTREEELTGQIFIALENRETVKLSLTDVYVIDSDTAESIVGRLKLQRDAVINPFYLQAAIDKWGLADATKGMSTLSPAQTANLQQRAVEDLEKFRRANRLSTYSNSVQLSSSLKVTTDVEGKFSLPVSTTERILFVATFRRTGYIDENYCWIVRVPSGATTVLLTNNNLVDTDSPENFARDAYRSAKKEPE